MIKIPIAFSFDNNLVLPACVTITSLLKSANEDTFYDIFILHSSKCKLDKQELDKLPNYFSNCRIQYRVVGDIFDDAFEIRGVTTPTYYRLLIPELISEYDKVIYADVDIVFRMDLQELYQMNLDDYYVAATHDLGMNLSADGKKYIDSMPELEQGKYLQAGFIVLNSKKIRENHLVDKFKNLVKNKYKYQDQDILNVSCKGKIKFLSPYYNMTDYSFYYAISEREEFLKMFSEKVLSIGLEKGTLHFNGHKPWKKYSVNFDIWWEVYRKSPFFDQKYYFDFYYNRLNELDQLSLWKRIKILIRYFVYGKRKI